MLMLEMFSSIRACRARCAVPAVAAIARVPPITAPTGPVPCHDNMGAHWGYLMLIIYLCMILYDWFHGWMMVVQNHNRRIVDLQLCTPGFLPWLGEGKCRQTFCRIRWASHLRPPRPYPACKHHSKNRTAHGCHDGSCSGTRWFLLQP